MIFLNSFVLAPPWRKVLTYTITWYLWYVVSAVDYRSDGSPKLQVEHCSVLHSKMFVLLYLRRITIIKTLNPFILWILFYQILCCMLHSFHSLHIAKKKIKRAWQKINVRRTILFWEYFKWGGLLLLPRWFFSMKKHLLLAILSHTWFSQQKDNIYSQVTQTASHLYL